MSQVLKNVFSVAQIRTSSHDVLFGPHDAKVYRNIEFKEELVVEGRRVKSVYVIYAETAYVDKIRKNKQQTYSS